MNQCVYGPLSQDKGVAAAAWHEGERTVMASTSTPRGHRIAAAGLLAAALAAVLAVAWFGGGGALAGQAQLRHVPGGASFEVKQLSEATWVQGGDFQSHAPTMDVDVEYQAPEGSWGTNYDHIPSPEMCAAMCQGVPACQAFTWVKNAGLDGCPSQCWLKGAAGTKVPKAGLVSGMIPPRKKFVAAPARDSSGGTLFCWSLMVPGTDETKLLKWQHENKASIFACDAARIYSNQVLQVAPGVVTKVVNSTLQCQYGGDSQSALNSWIFVAVWDKIVDDAEYRSYDWVVKADPDCVFFPDRLGRLLAQYPQRGYINNCKYGMHGPIEVFSSVAIDALGQDYAASWDGKAPKRCVTELDFGQWGEDMFIDQCLSKVLGITDRPLQPKLMCEAHCDCPSWYWCEEGSDVVSYHPFKSVDSYKNCMANALGGPAAAPVAYKKKQ